MLYLASGWLSNRQAEVPSGQEHTLEIPQILSVCPGCTFAYFSMQCAVPREGLLPIGNPPA